MTGPGHHCEAEQLLAEEVFATGHSAVTRSFEETIAATQAATGRLSAGGEIGPGPSRKQIALESPR